MQVDGKEYKMYMQRHRVTRNVLLALALLGGMAVTSAAFAQEREELFTPYRIAGLLRPSPPPIGVPPSETAGPAPVGTPEPSVVIKGVRLVKLGDYARAIELLEPYRSQENFLALHALGVAYVRTQRNVEAYEVLRRANTLNPEVAGPLLPAALACARMATRCDEYRRLAQAYLALGGKFKKLADKIANHQPFTLVLPRRQ